MQTELQLPKKRNYPWSRKPKTYDTKNLRHPVVSKSNEGFEYTLDQLATMINYHDSLEGFIKSHKHLQDTLNPELKRIKNWITKISLTA